MKVFEFFQFSWSSFKTTFILLAILLMSTCILTGCMVGPNFHSPPSPNLPSYNAYSLPKKTKRIPAAGKGGQSQVYVLNKDIEATWWTLFHSRALNHLIQVGLKNSPNIRAARAALRQAEENVNVQIGNLLFPAFDLAVGAERQRVGTLALGSASQSSKIFNLFNTSINVSYNLDFFGGSRRQIEALIAQTDYQQFQLMAAYLTLTANIATTAITIASLEAQIEATRELIRFDRAELTILRKQYNLGGISLATVLTQQTFVEQTSATLWPLEQARSAARHQLAALIGFYPNVRLPTLKLDYLTLPKYMPVSLPINLVRQRPDVRAAEALLHVASAQVGVATANLLPQITVTGSYGWQSLIASQLFQKSNVVWNVIGGLTQPLFHGGALLASRRAAKASFDQALAQYRQVMLAAFQNVADSLRALETDAQTLNALKNAELAANQSLKLTNDQFHLGGTSYLSLLIAQQQYQQARINRIRSQAARYTDTVALFQSLGGGWWHYTCAPCLAVDK